MLLKPEESFTFVMMIPLNLPAFDYQIKKAEGKLWIFDVLRKKYVVLFPEEWVRQHFIHYLLGQGYPKSLIKIEGGLVFNERRKRSDIVVFSRDGMPWMIIECKAPSLPVSQETFFQAVTYNQTLQAPFVAITNGVTHCYGSIDWEQGKASLLEALPVYPIP